MKYILFDDHSNENFLPLTFTRTLAELQIGLDTLLQKWSRSLATPVFNHTFGHLAPFINHPLPEKDTLWINSKFIPDAHLIKEILALGPDESWINELDEIVAVRRSVNIASISLDQLCEGTKIHAQNTAQHKALRFLPDLFLLNGHCLRVDFEDVLRVKKSQSIQDPHTIIYGRENIFVEEGVKVKAAIINAEDGPVYLGKNVTVQEGAIIHGAHAIGEGSVISMGAKLRGDTTIGPYAKVGGEVGNSVIQGFSNKAHDGYLGNSLIGSWCNIGADSNTSNLKNNYSEVKLWSYPKGGFKGTGSMFCGLIMGDHSKCGINTMFNTGTVVGVGANVFGDGYPRNFIPSFSWGGAAGFTTFKLQKMFEVAEIVMARRKKVFSEKDQKILKTIFEMTAQYRSWEKNKIG